MFSIDVVSDPSMALFPNDPMWSPELVQLRTYDEDLLKPAVMFAESIRLRSTREDMLSLNTSRALQIRRMPLRSVMNAAGVSLRRDPEEIGSLGLASSDLIPVDAAREFFEEDDRAGALVEFGRRFDGEILAVTQASMRVLRERRDILSGGHLGEAVRRGVVQSSGWSETDADPWSLAWREEGEFWVDGAVELGEMLATADGAIMLEPGSRRTLGPAEEQTGAADAVAQEFTASSLARAIAHGVVSRLPGLREIPLDELLDLRDDLREYVASFRAAMAQMAAEVSESEVQDLSIDAEVQRRWTVEIAPALQEMRHHVRSESYPRALLEAFSSDKASIAATASSVGLVAGSISAGVATLVPAAAAASFPFLKALNSRLKSRDRLRENRLYLLYAVERHARRTGK